MENEDSDLRLDKWLFAVRIFKTRSLAAKAIAGGKVKLNQKAVKPHKIVQKGDKILCRKEGREYQYTVLKCPEHRVGAKIAVMCYEIIVDPNVDEEVREMIELYREQDKKTRSQKGKPSKKDRREIRKLKGDL